MLQIEMDISNFHLSIERLHNFTNKFFTLWTVYARNYFPLQHKLKSESKLMNEDKRHCYKPKENSLEKAVDKAQKGNKEVSVPELKIPNKVGQSLKSSMIDIEEIQKGREESIKNELEALKRAQKTAKQISSEIKGLQKCLLFNSKVSTVWSHCKNYSKRFSAKFLTI